MRYDFAIRQATRFLSKFRPYRARRFRDTTQQKALQDSRISRYDAPIRGGPLGPLLGRIVSLPFLSTIRDTVPRRPNQNLRPSRPPPRVGALSRPEDQLMPLTAEQIEVAKRLRDQGLSYERIAKQIGISESASWKFFNPRPPKPKPPPPSKPNTALAPIFPPPTLYHGSIPIQRHITFIERNLPQPTRNEMYASLRTAVLNTRRA
jgi:hypothetical protein